LGTVDVMYDMAFGSFLGVSLARVVSVPTENTYKNADILTIPFSNIFWHILEMSLF
jgi:hypothetical protein